MWSAKSIYEEYRKIIREDRSVAPGENVFITLEDLQRHLALDDKDFEVMIKNTTFKISIQGKLIMNWVSSMAKRSDCLLMLVIRNPGVPWFTSS